MDKDAAISYEEISPEALETFEKAHAKILEISRDLKVSLKNRSNKEWQTLMKNALGLVRKAAGSKRGLR